MTNVHLGLEYSIWLEGAISWMVSRAEIEEYLALRGDDEAKAFIDEFWDRLDPYPESPGNPIRSLFDERAAEADQQFGESTVAGRRTARGIIHILYGPPETVDYEIPEKTGGATLEVWKYPKHSPVGLDGQRPSPVYRFSRRGGLTDFHRRRPF